MEGVTTRSAAGQLVERPPVRIHGRATLRQAADLLTDEAIGTLLVGGTEMIGIISERDIVRAIAAGADPETDRVSDVMSEDLATADVATPMEAVAELMLANEIRHVVVVDEGRPLGVLSMRDVLAVMTRTSG